MPKTKQQLSTAVLEQMREVGAGQTAAAEDADIVERRYDVKLEEWRDRGYVYWTNTNRYTAEIPDVVFQGIVDLMENETMHQFGRDNDPVQRRAIEERLLGVLIRLQSRRASGEPTKFEIF